MRKTFKVIFIIAWVLCGTQMVLGQSSEIMADLDSLIRTLDQIHPDRYNKTPKRKFKKIQRGIVKAGSQNDRSAQLTEVTRYVAAVGDGHTYFHLKSFHVFRLQSYFFDDGLFITKLPDQLKAFVGSKIISVNGRSISKVLRKLRGLIAYDNESQLKSKLPIFLAIKEYLEGVGILDRGEQSLQLQVIMPNGSKRDFRVDAVTHQNYFDEFEIVPSEFAQYLDRDFANYFTFADRLPRDHNKLFTSNPGRMYWHKSLKENDAFYIQYNFVRNDLTSIEEYTKVLTQMIIDENPEKLIIDVRTNPGGNNSLNPPWIEMLSKVLSTNKSTKLYVIIGRQTFSAATDFVASCEKLFNAKFVGEPTGGAPNHYGNPRTVTLPNSGFKLNVSSHFWLHVDKADKRDATYPQIRVPFEHSSYVKGQDVYLLTILGK